MIQELKHIADIARWLGPEPELVVVYDQNAAWVAGEVLEALPQVRMAVALETSEAQKTLETVQTLERQLLEAGLSRGALLLAVGGGITTDLVGFAASIYKRGIRYANLPTTLLAQVDAAIGGKTGVNLDGYKNMLGSFRMPEYTFLCADVLRTLPPRAYRCGLAELLKTFLLADGAAYAAALDGVTPELIARAAQIKAEIVERDPQEHGERAKLNLGHSFGHAIEHAAQERGDDIAHGEAVAIGMVLAARLSEQLGIGQKGLASQLERDFSALGLPTECPYPLTALQEAMTKDKKALGGGTVKYVLPVTPGQVVFHELNPYDLH